MSNQVYSGRPISTTVQYAPLGPCRDILTLKKTIPAGGGLPAYGSRTKSLTPSGVSLLFDRINGLDTSAAVAGIILCYPYQSIFTKPYWTLTSLESNTHGNGSTLTSIVDNVIAINALVPVTFSQIGDGSLAYKCPIRLEARIYDVDGITIVGNYGLQAVGVGTGAAATLSSAQGIVTATAAAPNPSPWAFSVSAVVKVLAGQSVAIFAIGNDSTPVLTYRDDTNGVVGTQITNECFVEFAKI